MNLINPIAFKEGFLNERMEPSTIDKQDLLKTVASRPFIDTVKKYFSPFKDEYQKEAFDKVKSAFLKTGIPADKAFKVMKGEAFHQLIPDLKPLSEIDPNDENLYVETYVNLFDPKQSHFSLTLMRDKDAPGEWKDFLIDQASMPKYLQAMSGKVTPFKLNVDGKKTEVNLADVLADRDIEKKETLDISDFYKDPNVMRRYRTQDFVRKSFSGYIKALLEKQ